ncbi:dTDP-4-dehydrorhamnose reductase [bacterium]|nr:dTDP-4-dehydrorhamnose reductase [bacterium]MBU1637564.1 dTDP-4-dehydrorhamnose reductase [bacterium]MBU1920651.1 dTDP-4-dehydrorhamnose reductase [bacterium]
MRKIIIIGADGQLGTDLMIELEKRNDLQSVGSTIADLDVTDFEGVRKRLTAEAPDIVVNTAAYHRVDEVETNAAKAFLVNVEAVFNMAKVCGELNCALAHFSTDYVFGGPPEEMPYIESDCPRPESIYAVSRLAGEYVIEPYCEKHFVIRSCGLYGHAGPMGKSSNFVETMLKLAQSGKPIRVVNDQRCTPTFTRHLAQKVIELVTSDKYGLFHMTNTGDCTWYEFAKKIFELAGVEADLSPCTTAEYPTPAKRPAYSVLDNMALRNHGFADLPHWHDALAEYLRDRKTK